MVQVKKSLCLLFRSVNIYVYRKNIFRIYIKAHSVKGPTEINYSTSASGQHENNDIFIAGAREIMTSLQKYAFTRNASKHFKLMLLHFLRSEK